MACCGGLPEAFLGFHSWKGGGKALGLSHESHGTKKGSEEIWSTDNRHERLKDDVDSFLQDALPDHLGAYPPWPQGMQHAILLYGPLWVKWCSHAFFLLIPVCAVVSHLCGAGNWPGTDSVLFLYLDHSRAEGTLSSCHGITACN